MRRSAALVAVLSALSLGCAHRPSVAPAPRLVPLAPAPPAPPCAEEGDSRQRIRRCRAIYWTTSTR